LINEYEFFGRLSRRVPGSVVFSSAYLTPLPLDRRSTVADLGCGFGHRATWVARSRCCVVHAFDRDAEHLRRSHERAEEGGAETLVRLHPASDYLELGLDPKSLDLIMAEGLGFEMDTLSALESWRPYLKDDGHIAVTCLGVVNRHPPQELIAPFADQGRELGTLEDYHAQIMNLQGFKLVHQVQLPPYAWEEHYQSIKRLIRGLLRSGEASAEDAVIKAAQEDLSWYQQIGRGRLFLQAFVLKVA